MHVLIIRLFYIITPSKKLTVILSGYIYISLIYTTMSFIDFIFFFLIFGTRIQLGSCTAIGYVFSLKQFPPFENLVFNN